MSTAGRRGWSLRAYVVGLVLLFAAVAAAGAIYEHQAATHDAAQSALQDARFGARLAARDIGADLGTLRATVASLAASQGIEKVFAAPSGCTLSFAAAQPPRAWLTTVCASRLTWSRWSVPRKDSA